MKKELKDLIKNISDEDRRALVPELLSDEKRAGSRKIPLTNKKIKELYQEIQKIRQPQKKLLKQLDEIQKELNPFQEKFAEQQKLKAPIEEEMKKITQEAKPIQDRYNSILEELQAPENKSQAIQAKLSPLVQEELKGKVAEFEEVVGIDQDKDLIFATVVFWYDLVTENRAKAREQKK